MAQLFCQPEQWKGRRAYSLSNGTIELVVLTGGGHIARLRDCSCDVNVLWESPWDTIEPGQYSNQRHAESFGAIPVGKFLASYTGHALALGYFGMPSEEEARLGLPLHGEASSREWRVIAASVVEGLATLEMEVQLPLYELTFTRKISLRPGSAVAEIHESVCNPHSSDRYIQWVQHVTFGEPFFSGDARLSVSARRGKTWPLGYEGRSAVADDVEFQWPFALGNNGQAMDLSCPFTHDQTGFVAALQVQTDLRTAHIAVLNRKYSRVGGYAFAQSQFPWVALWEENCAREYAPWNGRTRARGVEFGTSPMPLGLKQAMEEGSVFGTPVVARVPAQSEISANYYAFVARVPECWDNLGGVVHDRDQLTLLGPRGEMVRLVI